MLVAAIFVRCCYRAFILIKMRYEDKFIKHKATKFAPKRNEIIANVEFSEGDLMELQKILNESKSTWGIGLMIEIEKSFQNRDSLNAL
jgi:hypothetical protein